MARIPSPALTILVRAGKTAKGGERMTLRILLWLAVLLPGSALGQGLQLPDVIKSGDIISRQVPTGEVGDRVGCFAISTRTDDQLTISLDAEGFGGEVILARGALCASAAMQARRSWQEGQAFSPLSHTVVGGRYLVIVRSNGGKGSYKLAVTTGTDSDPDMADSIETATSPAPVADARIALMNAQTEKFRADEARAAAERARIAEQARRAQARAEAEARRRDAEMADMRARNDRLIGQAWARNMASLGNTIGQNLANESATRERIAQADIAARNAERARQKEAEARAAQRDAQTEQARRKAAEDLQAAQKNRQTADAAASRSAASGAATAGASADGKAVKKPAEKPEIIAMIEGVAVCPLNPDRAKLFGESICYGPFQDGLSDHNKPHDIALLCGDSASQPRDLGHFGNNHVWGCGFGINPRKSGFPNIDQAARFGLNIPSRRTYHCDAKIDGYCRSN